MSVIFAGSGEEPRSTQVVTVAMWVLGILGFVVAALVLLGWLPFGARANISRWEINLVEWVIFIGAILYGLSALHAGLGIGQGKRAGVRWGQWVAFATLFLGGAIIMSVVVPTALKHALLNGEGINLATIPTGATLNIGESQKILGIAVGPLGSLGGLLTTLGLLGFFILGIFALAGFVLPGLGRINYVLTEGPYTWPLIRTLFILLVVGVVLILFVGSFVVSEYRDTISKIRHPAYQHLIAGILFLVVGGLSHRVLRDEEEESDELGRAIALSPTKTIRSQLAKSPSAGAIIGAMAIFFFFAVTSNLFLEQSSIASILSNTSTKGIMAIGVTMLMISGEFDLSVGSLLGVASLSFLSFMTEGAPVLGVLQPLEAAILALFVTMILGAVNGLLLIFTRIPSFIVTLGTMLAFRAIALVSIAGGGILRYSDYHEFLPVWVIQGYVFVALAVVGIALLLFTAYRALPVMWGNLQVSAGKLRANFRRDAGPNEAFRSVEVLYRSVAMVVVALVLAVFIVWLAIVSRYHLTEDGRVTEIGFFDITNGRLVNHCEIDEAMIESGEAIIAVRRRLAEGECTQERIIDGEEVLLKGTVREVGITVSDGLIGWDVVTRANYRLSIVWWLFFVIIFHLLLSKTSYGNHVFAVGGNSGASRAQGVNVDRVKVRNFVILALLTGIAAIYEVARNPGVDPLKGEGYELEVIAMTVIGGTLLSGGYGSIIGTMLGALIVGMLQTGLVLVGIPSRLFAGTVGVTIIVAVVLNTFVRGASQD